MIHNQKEQKLVQSIRRGDKEALGTLWDTFTPKLFGYLINVTHNRVLAEDLLQTTWLKAIDAFPRFQQQHASISAWLFAIARNECRQHWRKAKWEVPLDPEIHDREQDEQKGIEDALVVEHLLAQLSEDDREVIRLRYIADLSVKDIARILDINFVAARVRIHRALARARVASFSHLL